MENNNPNLESSEAQNTKIAKLANRWEPIESIDIFCTVMEHHNPKLDIDRAIDIWNPRCPAAYRNAVKAEYQDAINNL